jgi:hypothetical protein
MGYALFLSIQPPFRQKELSILAPNIWILLDNIDGYRYNGPFGNDEMHVLDAGKRSRQRNGYGVRSLVLITRVVSCTVDN